MKATDESGNLVDIPNCYINIEGLNWGTEKLLPIKMKILPDISDSKGASYTNESGIGRSMPFKSYQNSEDRSISWTIHFIICKQGDADTILRQMRLLESLVYPEMEATGGAPYAPPHICKLKCGNILATGGQEVCAILKNYSVKFDPNVPWDEATGIPYKFDMDLQFEVVYDQNSTNFLAGAKNIFQIGY